MDRPSAEITLPVIEGVSDALETPMEDLPPLSDAIDLDALDTVASSDPPADVLVTFAYAETRVLVYSQDTVYVRPMEGETGVSVDRG